MTTAAATPWGVFGATAVVASLGRAIEAGHLAHAFLFVGPPGVGKATLARRLAQTLVCTTPPLARSSGEEQAEDRGEGSVRAEPVEGPLASASPLSRSAGEGQVPRSGNRGEGPCLECRACRQVDTGESPDVERIAIGGVCDEQGHTDHAADGSTRIRICQVRRLGRVASLAPFAAPRRIFILDSADDLQPEAAHALLKTLEEPPASVLLILLATDPDALLPTIRSRCQEIVLRPMPIGALEAVLVEHAGVDVDEAGALARAAHGRYGLAVRMHRDPALRMLRESVAADIERLLPAGRNERLDYSETLAARWSRERDAVVATLDLWREWWRDALLAAAGITSPPLHVGGEGQAPRSGNRDEVPANEVPQSFTAHEAVRALQAVQQAREHLLQNVNPQLALDVMVLDIPSILSARDGKEVPAAAR